LAEQPRTHFHTGESIPLRREAGDFLVGEPGSDGQAFEVLRILKKLLETAPVALIDRNDGRNAVDFVVERGVDLRWRNFQRVSRVILGEDDAVPIGDDPSIRDDRRDGNAVFVGLQRLLAEVPDLQVKKADADQPEADEHEQAGGCDPQAKLRQLLFGVLEFGHAIFAGGARGRRASATAGA
jgi:hypothetical protein